MRVCKSSHHCESLFRGAQREQVCFTFRAGSAEQQTPVRGAELGEGPGEAAGQSRPAFPCLPRSHPKEAITLASTRQGAGPFWRWTGVGGEDGQQGEDEHAFTYCQCGANVCGCETIHTGAHQQSSWTTWCDAFHMRGENMQLKHFFSL